MSLPQPVISGPLWKPGRATRVRRQLPGSAVTLDTELRLVAMFPSRIPRSRSTLAAGVTLLREDGVTIVGHAFWDGDDRSSPQLTATIHADPDLDAEPAKPPPPPTAAHEVQLDVSGFDLDAGGASRRVPACRQSLLAELTGVRPPWHPPATLTGRDWQGPRSCFDLVSDLAEQGGDERPSPFWQGPQDPDVAQQTQCAPIPTAAVPRRRRRCCGSSCP